MGSVTLNENSGMKSTEKTTKRLADQLGEFHQRTEKDHQDSWERFKPFVYSIVHDLKSPAVAIHGLTELLYRQYKDVLDDKGKSYCEHILKASLHVVSLIDKINVYIATKEAPLRIERLNVREIIRLVREEFSPRLAVRQIEWFEPEEVIKIKADKLSILRIFTNLVDNALKHGGEELSEIRIDYRQSEDFHLFSVSDNGVGIIGGIDEIVFAPFQRPEQAGTVEGAGLGLAIISEIAKRHRGEVWVEPGQAKGTTFYISLSKHI
jgi:light-regulated signal transduction histidine kinase (bacteriophytochrome)